MSTPRYIQISPDITDAELLEICDIAITTSYGCPAYLARLLQDIRAFLLQAQLHPELCAEDNSNSQWLNQQMSAIAQTLALVLFEFLHREGLVDADHQLDLDQLTERTRKAILHQQQS
jgi:hypothetical protein